MPTELALQKVNELREVAPEAMAEVIDGLATMLLLRQDLSNPMIGAKVTFHTNPKGDYVECSEEEYRELKEEGWPTMMHANGKSIQKADPDEIVTQKFVVADDEEREVTDYGTIARRAIVFEPGVAEAPEGIYWDPNKKEYTTPDDYPLGTVNLVLPADEDSVFGEDYVYDVLVETSVTPASGTPGAHTYTPGWP